MPIRHRFLSGIPDGPDATQVRPTNWNESHVFSWRLVAAGETLAVSDPIAATITTAQTFPIPGVVVAGDVFELRNNSNSTALASVDPGAGRQIQGAPVADTVTLSPGEQIAVFARTTTFFELLTPGAVGPVGPGGGVTATNATVSFGSAAAGAQVVETVIADAAIAAGSRVEVWLQGSTADNNTYEHAVARMSFNVIARTNGVNFTLLTVSDYAHRGQFQIAYRIIN